MAHLEALDEPQGDEYVDQRPQVHETLEASTSGREITKDMVLRSIERQSNARRPSNADAEEKFLLKQTHLHLNGHGICKISGLRCVPKVEVLYLYDNHIQMIENIHFLHNLRLLYLQNNNITHITGLDDLKGLSKLYLDNNCIQLITGLHACINLEELHISNQRLPPGMGVEFTPASVAAISRSLRVLTAINCSITSLALDQLFVLARLRRLDLQGNQIDSLEALESVLRPMPALQNLDLRGNPVCKAPKYRDSIVLMNDACSVLDDEAINQKQREFLLRFQLHRMKAALHAEARELGIAGPGEHAAARHEQQSVPSHPLQPPPRVPPRHGGFNSSAGAKHGSAGAGVTGGKLSRNSSSGQWVDLELGGTSIR